MSKYRVHNNSILNKNGERMSNGAVARALNYFETELEAALKRIERLKGMRKPPKEPQERLMKCKCGKSFTTHNEATLYCSKKCAATKMWLSDDELIAELKKKTAKEIAAEHGVHRSAVYRRVYYITGKYRRWGLERCKNGFASYRSCPYDVKRHEECEDCPFL